MVRPGMTLGAGSGALRRVGNRQCRAGKRSAIAGSLWLLADAIQPECGDLASSVDLH